MSEQWSRETGDRREEVRVVRTGDVEQRREIVEDIATARYDALSRVTQLIWLGFGVLIALIGLRVLLRLLAANPANPFANMLYMFTDLFLWPFHGLTPTPAAEGMVLEISSIIAMVVYVLVAWLIIRLIWLLFYRPSTRSISTYERDRTPHDRL
jgi:hypothetical protein